MWIADEELADAGVYSICYWDLIVAEIGVGHILNNVANALLNDFILRVK